jgi:uncharacterized protein
MPVQSPCIDICKLDATTGLCMGCLRTRDEIRGWKTMTDDERIVVIERAAQRVGQVKPIDPAPVPAAPGQD